MQDANLWTSIEGMLMDKNTYLKLSVGNCMVVDSREFRTYKFLLDVSGVISESISRSESLVIEVYDKIIDMKQLHIEIPDLNKVFFNFIQVCDVSRIKYITSLCNYLHRCFLSNNTYFIYYGDLDKRRYKIRLIDLDAEGNLTSRFNVDFKSSWRLAGELYTRYRESVVEVRSLEDHTLYFAVYLYPNIEPPTAAESQYIQYLIHEAPLEEVVKVLKGEV